MSSWGGQIRFIQKKNKKIDFFVFVQLSLWGFAVGANINVSMVTGGHWITHCAPRLVRNVEEEAFWPDPPTCCSCKAALSTTATTLSPVICDFDKCLFFSLRGRKALTSRCLLLKACRTPYPATFWEWARPSAWTRLQTPSPATQGIRTLTFPWKISTSLYWNWIQHLNPLSRKAPRVSALQQVQNWKEPFYAFFCFIFVKLKVNLTILRLEWN